MPFVSTHEPGAHGTLGHAWAGSAWQAEGRRHFAIVSRDLADGTAAPRAMAMSFFAHGFVPDPNAPARVAVFEKHGPGAAIVGLDTLTPERALDCGATREFYGHGAFTRDGALLFATEIVKDDTRSGTLGIYDGTTGARIGELPSGGVAPHDCVLVDDGAVLVVGHGGGALGQPDPPCVCWLELPSGKLLRKLVLDDPRFDVGHLALGDRGDLAIVSAPRHGTIAPERSRGGLTLVPRDRPQHSVDHRDGESEHRRESVAAMIGETLSVALHEPTRTVATTNPEGHLLAFWDLDDGSLRARLRVPNPRGVALTLDGNEFVVSFGIHGKLARVDARTCKPVDVPGNRDGVRCGATGSHLFVYDVAADADAIGIELPG